jgi:hypothetical protein
MIFGAPLILAGLAECTLAVSEYISLVTLAELLIVPARLMSGLPGTGPLRLEGGERVTAVKEVSRPERAARAARAPFVWGFVDVGVGVTGETGSGSMKGSAGKESCGRVGVEPGGGSLA